MWGVYWLNPLYIVWRYFSCPVAVLRRSIRHCVYWSLYNVCLHAHVCVEHVFIIFICKTTWWRIDSSNEWPLQIVFTLFLYYYYCNYHFYISIFPATLARDILLYRLYVCFSWGLFFVTLVAVHAGVISVLDIFSEDSKSHVTWILTGVLGEQIHVVYFPVCHYASTVVDTSWFWQGSACWTAVWNVVPLCSHNCTNTPP